MEIHRLEGEKLYGYTVNELIGNADKDAPIYAATSPKFEKVVLKIIPLRDETGINEYLFNTEVAELTILSHPHIIRLIDSHVTEDKQFGIIVLEKAECDLASFFKNNPNTDERVIRKIAFQVLTALKHIHSMGHVHRDVKPENILVMNDDPTDPFVVLSDFGFSTQVYPGISGKCGTAYYFPPEIIMGYCYDQKVDLFSFGVTLYFLCAKKFPWDTPDRNLAECKACYGYYDFNNAVWLNFSKEVKDLINNLLAPAPMWRITAKMALHCDWFDGLDLHEPNQNSLFVPDNPCQQRVVF